MTKILTRPERPSDNDAILALHNHAFGPGAYARAAFRVREQAPHDMALSFVTERDGVPIASVRLTPIRVGETAGGLLLGPLVVEPEFKGQGHGKALMRLAVEEARKAGCPFIFLVGDQPYYWPFGFRPVPPKTVLMPGPVDPARLLVAELKPGAANGLAGMVAGVRAPSGRCVDGIDAEPRHEQRAAPYERGEASRPAGEPQAGVA